MDRGEIIAKMRQAAFPPGEYWIQTGAALVLRGVRQMTHDIDVGCTPTLIRRLQEAGCPYEDMPDGHRKYVVGEDIEVSEGWAPGTVEYIEGLPVVGLEDVIRVKEALGRAKDYRDIQRIRAFQAKTQ